MPHLKAISFQTHDSGSEKSWKVAQEDWRSISSSETRRNQRARTQVRFRDAATPPGSLVSEARDAVAETRTTLAIGLLHQGRTDVAGRVAIQQHVSLRNPPGTILFCR